MKVNFTDVPDSVGFDPVPPGEYVVTVTKGEMGESGDNAKHPGTPYINWDLVVAEGQFQGRHIFTVTSLWPDSLQYGLKPLLKAVGGFNTDSELDFEIEDVINKQLIVKVNIQKQEGYDDKNNVRAFKPLSDGVSAPTSNSLLP